MEGDYQIRKVKGDGSCLFYSLLYCIDKQSYEVDPISANIHYREIVAQAYELNRFELSELTHNRNAQAKSIRELETMGDHQEIFILAKHFGIEVVVVDNERARCEIVNEGQSVRIYLYYRNIHYDPIVLSFDNQSNLDISQFSSSDSETMATILNKYLLPV